MRLAFLYAAVVREGSLKTLRSWEGEYTECTYKDILCQRVHLIMEEEGPNGELTDEDLLNEDTVYAYGLMKMSQGFTQYWPGDCEIDVMSQILSCRSIVYEPLGVTELECAYNQIYWNSYPESLIMRFICSTEHGKNSSSSHWMAVFPGPTPLATKGRKAQQCKC